MSVQYQDGNKAMARILSRAGVMGIQTSPLRVVFDNDAKPEAAEALKLLTRYLSGMSQPDKQWALYQIASHLCATQSLAPALQS